MKKLVSQVYKKNDTPFKSVQITGVSYFTTKTFWADAKYDAKLEISPVLSKKNINMCKNSLFDIYFKESDEKACIPSV